MADLECKITYNKIDSETAAKELGLTSPKEMMEKAFKNRSLYVSKGTSFKIISHEINEDKKCVIVGIVTTEDEEVIKNYYNQKIDHGRKRKFNH